MKTRPKEAPSTVPSILEPTHRFAVAARPLAVLAVAAWIPLARAAWIEASFSSGFADGGQVPDGSLNGWSDQRVVNTPGTTTQLVVTLAVSGGYNSDLYAYISHGGLSVPLLNRVGITADDPFGYDNAGLSVTFRDDATHGDIHLYQLVADYPARISDGSAFQPDGRNLPPTTEDSAAFDTADRLRFDTFRGTPAEGAWTLFVADVSAGGGPSTITGWGLQITSVPEPITTLLTATSLCAGAAAVRALSKQKQESARAA